MSRAQMDKRPVDVAGMFDQVAARYDATNTILSAGQDRRWRALVRRSLDLRPGELVLDAAAGTGSSAMPLAAAGARVVAADFSLGMLRAGQRRRDHVPLCAADATRLPFADSVFDAVTISFGLRNVDRPGQALAELYRVTKPGGRILICEFSQPPWAPFRRVYLNYLMRALPAVARQVSSNPESYVYLAESIQAWPAQSALASMLTEAGWQRVGWRNATGGIVALHRGYRPAPPEVPGSLPTPSAAGVDSAGAPDINPQDGRQPA